MGLAEGARASLNASPAPRSPLREAMQLQAGIVSIGDRFIKVGQPYRTTYVVESFVVLYDLPPHVRLAANEQSDRMLMSVSALLDRRFWIRVPAEQL